VGPTGKVIGMDMASEMIEKARLTAQAIGQGDVEFLHCEIENLPLADGTVDFVIPNGVFNLCPNKPTVLAEAYRERMRFWIPILAVRLVAKPDSPRIGWAVREKKAAL
jgi:trans-aconitate methyltransferase